MQTIIKQKFPQANFQNKDIGQLLKVYYKYNKSDYIYYNFL